MDDEYEDRPALAKSCRLEPRDDEHLGLVLIAHGSRRAEANQDLHEIAERLRGRGYRRVVASFLELAEPGIVDGGLQCADAGARRVVLSPYFLSAGRHVATDLEEARAELERLRPDVEFLLAGPLGPHPLLDHLLTVRVRERLRDRQREAVVHHHEDDV
ncbi:MAG: sirohydrochlorin chelatase [Planctomycetia bacterium]